MAAIAAPGVVVGTVGQAEQAKPPRLCATGTVHQDLAKGRAAKGGRLTAVLQGREAKGWVAGSGGSQRRG